MKRVICLLTLLFATGARAQLPAVTLRIAQGGKVVSDGMALVTNVDHIWVRAKLPPQIARQSEVSSRSMPMVDLTITSNADGKVVPSRYAVTAFNVAPEGASIEMILEIPVSADERSAVLAGYIDDVIRGESSPQLAGWLRSQRDQAIAALERSFVQQRPGDYVLCFQLANPRIEGASATIPLRVVETGTFADRLKEPAQGRKPE